MVCVCVCVCVIIRGTSGRWRLADFTSRCVLAMYSTVRVLAVRLGSAHCIECTPGYGQSHLPHIMVFPISQEHEKSYFRILTISNRHSTFLFRCFIVLSTRHDTLTLDDSVTSSMVISPKSHCPFLFVFVIFSILFSLLFLVKPTIAWSRWKIKINSFHFISCNTMIITMYIS